MRANHSTNALPMPGIGVVALFSLSILVVSAQQPQQSPEPRKWGSPCAELFSKLFSAEPVRTPRYQALTLSSTSEELASAVNGVIEITAADLEDKAAMATVFEAKRRIFLREESVDEKPQDFLETGVERVRVLLTEPGHEKGGSNLYGWQENKPEELRPHVPANEGGGSKVPKEKDGLVDAMVPGGLKSEAAFLEGLKRKDGAELIILAGQNGQGMITFQDGGRMDLNLALVKIHEAGHLPLVLSCKAKFHAHAPAGFDETDCLKEFTQALQTARQTLREKGCHQFYPGDYLFSIDEFFHTRKIEGKSVRFALRPTGAGGFTGVLLFAASD